MTQIHAELNQFLINSFAVVCQQTHRQTNTHKEMFCDILDWRPSSELRRLFFPRLDLWSCVERLSHFDTRELTSSIKSRQPNNLNSNSRQRLNYFDIQNYTGWVQKSYPHATFVNITHLWNNKIHTLSPSFAEIYLKTTKLCRFNQDNSQFLSSSEHHAELAVPISLRRLSGPQSK